MTKKSFYDQSKETTTEPSRIFTTSGWPRGEEDGVPTTIYAEPTDRNEVMLDMHSQADFKGAEPPYFQAHISAIQAIELAGQLRAAAEEALRGFGPDR